MLTAKGGWSNIVDIAIGDFHRGILAPLYLIVQQIVILSRCIGDAGGSVKTDPALVP